MISISNSDAMEQTASPLFLWDIDPKRLEDRPIACRQPLLRLHRWFWFLVQRRSDLISA